MTARRIIYALATLVLIPPLVAILTIGGVVAATIADRLL